VGETGREGSHPVESTNSVFPNDCKVIVHSTGLQGTFPTFGADKHHVPDKSIWSDNNDIFLRILETDDLQHVLLRPIETAGFIGTWPSSEG
jgi:hypothetical protein